MNVFEFAIICLVITIILAVLILIFVCDFGPYYNHRLFKRLFELKTTIALRLQTHYGNQVLYNVRRAEIEKKFLKQHLPYRPKYIQKYYDFLELLEDNNMVKK